MKSTAKSPFRENTQVNNKQIYKKSQFSGKKNSPSKMNVTINQTVPYQEEQSMKKALELTIIEKQDSLEKMQSLIQKLNYEVQTKVERCDYLKDLFDVKTQETQQTEQVLKKEISEVNERLEILKLFKKRENFTTKQFKDKNSFKLDQQIQQLEKLQKEEKELENKIVETDRVVSDEQEDKIIKLRAALRPLDEAKVEIEQCLQLYSSRMRLCEQTKDRKELQLNLQKQESQRVIEQQNQLQVHIEILLQEQQRLRESYQDEFEIFEKEYREEVELQTVLQEKLKVQEKIKIKEKYQKKLRDDISKNENEIQEIIKKLQNAENQIKEGLDFQKGKRNLEIKKVEQFFKDKQNEFNSSSFIQVVGEHINTELLIQEKQIKHLITQKEKIAQQEKINDLKQEKVIQSLKQQLENDKTIKQEARNWISQKYYHALDQQKKARVLLKTKEALLQSKIIDFESNTYQLQEIKKKFDIEEVKLSYLKKMWARMSCDGEERINFQNILEMYMERVKQREDVITSSLKEQDSLTQQRRYIQQENEKLILDFQQVEDEIDQLKEQVKELVKKEKAITKSLEERQAQVEFQLFKIGEKNFDDYYKRHEELFDGVKKTYGKKVADKMKTEQKKEFTNMTVDQYRRRIAELKEKAGKVHEIQMQIEELQKKHIDVIQVEVQKAQVELNKHQNDLTIAHTQFQVVQEAYMEIQREIDTLNHSKQLELKKQAQQIYRNRNYENQRARLNAVKELVFKKENNIQQLKSEIFDKDSVLNEKTTNYKAEDGSLKIRMENLKKAQTDLQKIIKPQLVQMEREVKELTFQINQGRKKLEILFEKYQTASAQLQMAKKTMYDKFGLEMEQLQSNEYIQNLSNNFQSNKDTQDGDIKNFNFEFDEEFKKMQVVIEADEKNKITPLTSQQHIQVIQEEDKEDDVSQTDQYSVQNISMQNKIDKNMKDLLSEFSNSKEQQNNVSHQLMNLSIPNSNTNIFDPSKVVDILTHFGEKLQINLNGCTQQELEFFDKVRALLEGEEVFKKFGASTSITQKPFDPLDKNLTPDQRGYGKRFIRITPEFTKLEFIKQAITNSQQSSLGNTQNNIQGSSLISQNRHVVENSIELSQIMKVIIPGVSQDILKFQKHISSSLNRSQSSATLGGKRELELYKEKCLEARFYPFSLVSNEKNFEFVASDYLQFKFLTEGLDEIIKLQKKYQYINPQKFISNCTQFEKQRGVIKITKEFDFKFNKVLLQ